MAAITLTQFRNALYQLGLDQQVATPALLRRVERYRPGGMSGEKPAYWVGQVRHDLTHDMGTRNHNMTADVIVATTFPSDDLTASDPFDELLDALVDRYTSAVRVIPNTTLTMTAIEDGEVPFDGKEQTSLYRGATITVRLVIWEGIR